VLLNHQGRDPPVLVDHPHLALTPHLA
jgi:hypothetical protein